MGKADWKSPRDKQEEKPRGLLDTSNKLRSGLSRLPSLLPHYQINYSAYRNTLSNYPKWTPSPIWRDISQAVAPSYNHILEQ